MQDEKGREIWTVYKFCRTCEGRKEVEVTLTVDGQATREVLPCPHCYAQGTHLWGYMVKDDNTRGLELPPPRKVYNDE